jgi:DNA-nicking Smr family endonuclease
MRKGAGQDDDARAFEEAMSGARPLPGGPRRVVGAPQPRPRPASSGGPRPGRAASVPAPAPSAEAVAGRAPDVSARELRALRSGERRPEARLDLHGMTREEALDAAERFVQRSRAGGLRAVLIIHGRGLNSDGGDPVLRPAVLAWLGGAAATRAGVMAYAPAPQRAGGPGATVVLLRR